MPVLIVPEPYHNLSEGEHEVLAAYASGQTYDQIARARHKSWHTIKNQLNTARRKLGAQSTMDAWKTLTDRERNRGYARKKAA